MDEVPNEDTPAFDPPAPLTLDPLLEGCLYGFCSCQLASFLSLSVGPNDSGLQTALLPICSYILFCFSFLLPACLSPRLSFSFKYPNASDYNLRRHRRRLAAWTQRLVQSARCCVCPFARPRSRDHCCNNVFHTRQHLDAFCQSCGAAASVTRASGGQSSRFCL